MHTALACVRWCPLPPGCYIQLADALRRWSDIVIEHRQGLHDYRFLWFAQSTRSAPRLIHSSGYTASYEQISHVCQALGQTEDKTEPIVPSCSTWWSIPLLTCFPGGALNSIDEPLTESLGSQKLMSLATVISKYFALTDVVYIPYIEVADR